MGSCISKDLHGAPQPTSAELQQQQQQPGTEDQAVSKEQTGFCWVPLKKCFKPAVNGIGQEKKQTPDGFEIAELATSSLLGLVATIKERITKPTAMAQGRVAHLIEWKGWNSKQQGWGAAPLQDEEQYSDLTDELKEARFAAGVAEQFAIAEATMSAWSSMDGEVEQDGKLTQDSALFPGLDAEGVYLQQLRMNGTQRLYSINLDGGDETSLYTQEPSPSVPSLQTQSIRDMLTGNLERQGPLLVGRSSVTGHHPRRSSSIRHADSSSISEDEVFYN
ncbi:protein FAM131C-like [Polyodon spathula]|uniref:protein FAM131C-like n=1 Tax=Polyodon spathula TaxID=7913 RepID=UPI001B7EE141|nr:protein FAM131C-like [Polyodon spathula]